MKKPKTAIDEIEAIRKETRKKMLPIMRKKLLAIYVRNFAPIIPMALGLVVISTLIAIWFEWPYWVGLIIGLIIVSALTLWP